MKAYRLTVPRRPERTLDHTGRMLGDQAPRGSLEVVGVEAQFVWCVGNDGVR